jgi:integrase/recombinase XerD
MHERLLSDFADFQRGEGLAATTIRNRASTLRGLAAFTGRPLLAMTTADVRRFLGRDITNGSRRTYGINLRAFYAYAVAEGLRDDDPTARLGRPPVERGTPRPFAEVDVDRMLASGAYRRTRAMILLGYYQGFRVSSIAAVHGRDVDLVAMTIRTVGKGRKERTLPLHPMIAELAATMPRDGWWFPARGGRTGHVRPASVTDRITRAKHRAGITNSHLTPHSLRHGFGSGLVEEGVDIRVVQELMMHATLSSTEIYTAVSERRKREGIAALPSRTVPTRSGRRAA